jgi:hypothetical protein
VVSISSIALAVAKEVHALGGININLAGADEMTAAAALPPAGGKENSGASDGPAPPTGAPPAGSIKAMFEHGVRAIETQR